MGTFTNRVLVTCVWIALTTSSLGQDAPLKIPVRLSEIRFIGNESFASPSIRGALAGQADFWVANHTQSNADRLANELSRLITSGYHSAGFRDVFVDAFAEESAIECKIIEGPRYRCGHVRVKNASGIDEASFLTRMTKPFPARDTFPATFEIDGQVQTRWVDQKGADKQLKQAVWKAGEFARLGALDSLSKAVSAALDDVGYPGSFATVKYIYDEESMTTDLLVDLVKAGEPSVISAIEFEGLEQNHAKPLLDYLEITRGSIFNATVKKNIEGKLWQCGRFSDFDFAYDRDMRKLTIKLKEIDGLPTIDESIGPIGTALLRARQRFVDCYRRGEDTELIADLGPWRVRSTFSSEGLIAEARYQSQNHECELLLQADDQTIQFANSKDPRKLILRTRGLSGRIQLSTALGAAEEPDHAFRSRFDVNLSSDREPNEPPFIHRWLASPASWLALKSKKGLQTRLSKGKLYLSETEAKGDSDAIRMCIDCETGAIEELEGVVSLRMASGLYEKARARVSQSLRNKEDVFRLETPITSLASYLLSEPMVSCYADAFGDGDDIAALASVFRKMTDNGVLAIPDALATYLRDGNADETFTIPSRNEPKGATQQIPVEMVAKLILQHSPNVLPNEGWPIEVTREACMIAMGRADFSKKVLEDLMKNPHVGPVGHTTIAALLDLAGQDAKRAFALRGLSVLNEHAFHKDYQMLMSDSGRSMLARTIGAVQALSDAELQTMISHFDEPNVKAILSLIHANRLANNASGSGLLFQMCRQPLSDYLSKTAR